MARRRKMSEAPEPSPETEAEETLSDPEEAALIAALDQHEAEARGEANPPPSEAEKPEEPEEPEKPIVPEGDGRPKVALRVFIASGGLRWDQMAGFKSYAIRSKMGPLSIPEWREAFNAFMKRPV